MTPHALARTHSAEPWRSPVDSVRVSGSDFDPAVDVIVPTRNEAANVVPLLERLGPVLAEIDGAVLFVDDSTDNTPAVVTGAAANSPAPIGVLHREPSERLGGLGGAVQAGVRATHADWIVVMDGDLQHPPEVIAAMLYEASRDDIDLVVATRYVHGGTAGGLASPIRSIGSSGATAAAKALFPAALGRVSDPMSGFFAFRRAAVEIDALRPRGFKILLELLVRCPGLRVREVPYTFATRHSGDSKASAREAGRYLRQLVALRFSPSNPVGRLMRFAAVGGSGVAVNLAVLALLLHLHRGGAGLGSESFDAAAATQLAVAWNFALTERWVFAHRPGSWLRRLVPYWALSCGALVAQLPLAALLAPALGGSYLFATAAALALLVVLRFAVCDKLLYGPRLRSRRTRFRRFATSSCGPTCDLSSVPSLTDVATTAECQPATR